MDYRIVYVNAQIIFAIMFIVLYAMERVNRKSNMPIKLNALYGLFFSSLVLDSIWILIDGRPELRNFNIALNVVYLIIMAYVGYLWFLYTLDMFPSKTILRKLKHLLAIPVLIDIFLVIASVKTGQVFSIDQNGTYHRASLHILSFMINYSFMLLGSYAALIARKEATLTADKKRLGVAALFPLPIVVLVAVQFILPPGLPAFQGGVLIALLLVYAVYQNVLVTSDTLTGLPNRYAFETDLMAHINGYYDSDSHLYLLAGDLDNFKNINDTMGHPVGDRILVIAADVLKEYFEPYGSLVFRVGGDEFMVIAESKTPLDIDRVRKSLNTQLRKKGEPLKINVGISLGMSEYTADKDFKALIEEADENLYSDKYRLRKK